MKKLILLFAFYSCSNVPKNNSLLDKQSTAIDQTDNRYTIIQTFADEIKNENDSVLLINEFREWNVSENFDLSINGKSYLPKTDKERLEMLASKVEYIENPYPVLYTFAFPMTDSLFNESERQYMRDQALDTKFEMSGHIHNVNYVDKMNTAKNKISMAAPLINRDSTKAILNVFYNAFYYKEIGYIGERQYIYYIKETTGWKRIFATDRRLF